MFLIHYSPQATGEGQLVERLKSIEATLLQETGIPHGVSPYRVPINDGKFLPLEAVSHPPPHAFRRKDDDHGPRKCNRRHSTTDHR
jgi:hypothetical protein